MNVAACTLLPVQRLMLGTRTSESRPLPVVEQSTLKATCDTCQNVRKGSGKKKRKEKKKHLLLSMFCAYQRFGCFQVGSVGLFPGGKRVRGLGYPGGQN